MTPCDHRRVSDKAGYALEPHLNPRTHTCVRALSTYNSSTAIVTYADNFYVLMAMFPGL